MRPSFLQLACSQGWKSRTWIIDLLSGDVAPQRGAALSRFSDGATASLSKNEKLSYVYSYHPAKLFFDKYRNREYVKF